MHRVSMDIKPLPTPGPVDPASVSERAERRREIVDLYPELPSEAIEIILAADMQARAQTEKAPEPSAVADGVVAPVPDTDSHTRTLEPVRFEVMTGDALGSHSTRTNAHVDAVPAAPLLSEDSHRAPRIEHHPSSLQPDAPQLQKLRRLHPEMTDDEISNLAEAMGTPTARIDDPATRARTEVYRANVAWVREKIAEALGAATAHALDGEMARLANQAKSSFERALETYDPSDGVSFQEFAGEWISRSVHKQQHKVSDVERTAVEDKPSPRVQDKPASRMEQRRARALQRIENAELAYKDEIAWAPTHDNTVVEAVEIKKHDQDGIDTALGITSTSRIGNP